MFSQKICVTSFLNKKGQGGTVNQKSVYAEAAVRRVLQKSVKRNFAEFTRKHLCRNFIFDKVKLCRSAASLKTSLWRKCFLVNLTKLVRTPFLQNTTGRLLLIIAVSVAVK